MDIKPKYPENLRLKQMQLDSGKTVKHIAKVIGVSARVVSQTIHGHYKGVNIVPLIEKELK
jgi:DNA transposition AAA+ family ATPase